jgi:hypothetical protein
MHARCNDCTSRGDPRYCDICNAMWVLYVVDDDDDITINPSDEEVDDG